MHTIHPKALKNGDTIGFLTACGPVENFDRIETAKKYFENKGFKVVISDTTYMKKDFLCAPDAARVAQIHEFFEDDNIDAILCTRGGYGALRLIDKLDYELIRRNPKFFGGFSDVTVLLNMIYKKSGLITYHSAMAHSDFGEDDVSELSKQSLFSAFYRDRFFTEFDGKTYSAGAANGVLVGGNLATLASMVGSDFLPEENFILFIEDINEPAYKIDRYLTQLNFNKNFSKYLAGIALGAFTGCEEKDYFDNIFKELGETLNIPIMSGLKIGHVRGKVTIPVGIHTQLDTEEKTLKEINL